MPWHITEQVNIASILAGGLIPAIGPRSAEIDEPVPLVHLFSRFEDFQSASWLEDCFSDDVELGLFHVDIPAAEGAWTEIPEPIPVDRLTLITRDIDSLSATEIRTLHLRDGQEGPDGIDRSNTQCPDSSDCLDP